MKYPGARRRWGGDLDGVPDVGRGHPEPLRVGVTAGAACGPLEPGRPRVLLEVERLPQHGGLPAKVVAERLGFADPGDFTKFFRLRPGTTPGVFRARSLGRATRATGAAGA
ncbi:helix-turn-helix domain-containing protein [Streptomyces sp. NPDC001848]|uniref:helix-turn-helix domain-containing protein n=1 Tax=Streptomyces sp. NPDC001848 TaxID=3364618 RepID=UPI0036AA0CFE